MRDPEDLWKKQPGKFFYLATKSRTGKWVDHAIKRGDWDAVDEIIGLHRGGDIYMCPHGFSSGEHRQKSNSVDPHLLYADLDEADPSEVSIKPTIAIESSPGRYVGYWLTDGPASEDLNRRLAYTLGADASGWDRTQVLRVPGTRNFKYKEKPRVKVLWSDGPTYKIDRLEKMLPDDIPSGALPGKTSDVMNLYQKYEQHLARWARKELLEGNPRTGKRSEVLWKLQNALIEAGCSTEEMFQLLWVSPWNKFRERRGGEAQLRAELSKNLTRRLNSDPAKDPEDKEKQNRIWDPLPRSISEVERREIDWLVPKLLARKELTIVEGDPGLGKSYLVQVIAGLVCDGKRIPVLDPYTAPKGKVAYFDTENTADTVTKARLMENGVTNMSNYFQGEEGFSIDDEERWQLVVDRLRELAPELIVFDTINTYIGSTDTYRSSETQQAMGFFKFLATELDCSVILLRHLTKGSGKAIYRGQGSIAFTGAARIVATVGTLPDDESLRVVACTKNNLTEPFRSFTYTIESLPDRNGMTNRSRLLWGDMVDVSADAIIQSPVEREKTKEKTESEIDVAKKVLANAIKEDGKVLINKILKQSHNRSVSKQAIYRAAELMELERVEVRRGEFYWAMP